MEATIYVNIKTLPAIDKLAEANGMKFTLGTNTIGGKFVDLHILDAPETYIIAFIHAIGLIEGRLEKKNMNNEKRV